jgi:hypothetical protein
MQSCVGIYQNFSYDSKKRVHLPATKKWRTDCQSYTVLLAFSSPAREPCLECSHPGLYRGWTCGGPQMHAKSADPRGIYARRRAW